MFCDNIHLRELSFKLASNYEVVRKAVTLSVIVSIISILPGCLGLNDVSMVSTYSFDRPMPKAGRAIVVFGIGVEGQWDYLQFGTVMDEYSIERQAITGNCWRYNNMRASVTAIAGTRQYFVFDVQPGYYAYSSFNAVQLSSSERGQAFKVPEGRIVYLGDFIYARSGVMEVQRDPEAVKAYFKGDAILADILPVHPPKPFLCMP